MKEKQAAREEIILHMKEAVRIANEFGISVECAMITPEREIIYEQSIAYIEDMKRCNSYPFDEE